MYSVKRVELYSHSVSTGHSPRKVIKWHIIDSNGIVRDSMGKKKDALACVERLNRKAA